MPQGRPDNKDLLFPDTLRRLRKKAGFGKARAFAEAVPCSEETIGHYERGERRPSKGMVEDMVLALERKKDSLDYSMLITTADHDRQLWDMAALAVPDLPAAQAVANVTLEPPPPPPQAARAADGRWHLIVLAEELDDEDDAAAAEDNDITIIIPPPPRPPSRPIALLAQRVSSLGDESEGDTSEEDKASTSGGSPEESEEEKPKPAVPISVPAPPPVPAATPTASTLPPPPPSPINIQPPLPTTPRPPRTRHRAWKLVRIVAVATAIALMLTLLIVGRQAHLPNTHPVLVATLTRAVITTTSMPALTQVPSTTPTRAPTATPTHAPTAIPTQIPTATPVIITPSGTLTLTRTGPSQCNWDVTIKVWGFVSDFGLDFSGSAKGRDCKTGAPSQDSAGPDAYLCQPSNDGACQQTISFSDLAPIILGSHVYDIYNTVNGAPWQEVRLTAYNG